MGNEVDVDSLSLTFQSAELVPTLRSFQVLQEADVHVDDVLDRRRSFVVESADTEAAEAERLKQTRG